MTHQPPSTDELKAAKRCLEIYGGDIARWPAKARDAYGAAAMSAVLENERHEAGEVDALLDRATEPLTPHDLKKRLAATFTQKTGGPRGAFSGFDAFSAWLRPLPAAGFASLAVMGFATAAFTDKEAGLAPEFEAYAYLEGGAFDDAEDEGGLSWDAE